MLFSNDDIANYVNQAFEPVWQPVRPVPIVRIDFGNDHVLTRTLHGNIATYVCTSDGLALDILPGIYEPTTYLDRLNQFTLLHRWASRSKIDRTQVVANFHDQQLASIATGAPALQIADLDISKYRIEGSATFVLLPGVQVDNAERTSNNSVDSVGELAAWSLLAEDTRINETQRRRLIHEKLATLGLVPPDQITKWLYREVLHADLDDPYLGLGEVLFANYPFRAEDG